MYSLLGRRHKRAFTSGDDCASNSSMTPSVFSAFLWSSSTGNLVYRCASS